MPDLQDRATFLRTLADPTRLRLLCALGGGELTVAEITHVTSLSQPRVSRHLKLLAEARLLARSPDQNHVYYRLCANAEHLGLVRAALEGLQNDPDLARDAQRLQAILERRRVIAKSLIDQEGVRPLSDSALMAVKSTIDALLARHLNGADLGDMLDIGTGAGTMLRLLGKRVRSTIGISQSREMRLVARATALSEGLTNCSVRDGDMYALSFPPESFDVITMDRILGVAERPHAALREAARVLRRGGYLLVIEASGSPVTESDLKAWTEDSGLSPLEFCCPEKQPALVALSVRSSV